MPGVVPSCSAALEIVYEQPATEDADVCEESEIVAGTPVVVPTAARKSDFEEIATGDVDACEEPEIVVDIQVAVPSVVPVSIS